MKVRGFEVLGWGFGVSRFVVAGFGLVVRGCALGVRGFRVFGFGVRCFGFRVTLFRVLEVWSFGFRFTLFGVLEFRGFEVRSFGLGVSVLVSLFGVFLVRGFGCGYTGMRFSGSGFLRSKVSGTVFRGLGFWVS